MTSRPHYESPDDDVGLNVLRCQADILAGRGGGWGLWGGERGGNMTSRPHYESPDDDVGLNVLRRQADILGTLCELSALV